MGILGLFKKKKSISLNSNLFGGGDGSSEQSAVVIKSTSSLIGIPAEYEYIKSLYGNNGSDWELNKQMHYDNNSRSYDTLEIRLSNGLEKTIYFDITNFYGKL